MGRKKLAADKELFTIKVGLRTLLKEPILFSSTFEDLAASVSIWRHRASILHNLHFTRLMKEKKSLDQWSENDCDRAFYMVSDSFEETEADSELFVTYRDYYVPIFGENVSTPMKRRLAAVPCCELARRDYMTSLSNNILTNFYPRLVKWCKLQIMHFYVAQGLDLPDIPFLGRASYLLATMVMDPNKHQTEEKMLKFIKIAKEVGDLPETLTRGFIKRIGSILLLVEGFLHARQNKITNKRLAKHWFRFIPWMYRVLTDFEQWHKSCAERLQKGKWDQDTHNFAMKKYKLFRLCPQFRDGIGHVHVDTRVLRYLWNTIKKADITEKEFRSAKNQHWNSVFELQNFIPANNCRDMQPYYFIRTDGIAASVNFIRNKSLDATETKTESKGKRSRKTEEKEEGKKKQKMAEGSKLIKQEKTTEAKEVTDVRQKIEEGACVIGLDPGKVSAYFAVSQYAELGHKNRIASQIRLSGGHYRWRAGEAKRRLTAARWTEELKVLLGESDKKEEKNDDDEEAKAKKEVSTKTASFEGLQINYVEEAKKMAIVWAFRSKRRQRRLRFDSYMMHQSADDFACNRLIQTFSEGGQRHVIIAFGTARFYGAPTKRIYKALQSRYKHKCTIADVDEYYTSQKCPRCYEQISPVMSSNTGRSRKKPPLDEQYIKYRKKRDDCKKEVKKLNACVYGLFACQKCSVVYDRDSMGAENILNAFNSLIQTTKRPNYLARPHKDDPWTMKKLPKMKPIQLLARFILKKGGDPSSVEKRTNQPIH